MTQLNNDNSREGDYVYSFWSQDDDIIGDWAWGRHISAIPRSTGDKIFTGLGHMQMKDLTPAQQYEAVVNHNITGTPCEWLC